MKFKALKLILTFIESFLPQVGGLLYKDSLHLLLKMCHCREGCGIHETITSVFLRTQLRVLLQ